MKPSPFNITHVMQMRFSQARLSSTVFPLREKFIISKATDAVTMAATVEMSTIWVYTSFIISLALSHIVVAITGWQCIKVMVMTKKAEYAKRQTEKFLRGWLLRCRGVLLGLSVLFFNLNLLMFFDCSVQRRTPHLMVLVWGLTTNVFGQRKSTL